MSSTNLMKRLELCDGVQSWVSRVKRRGLSTHPWGAPVFSVMVLDELDQFVSELLRDDCVEC